MSAHPYRAQPDRAFWSRAVSRGFAAADVMGGGEPVFRHGDRVVSAGSCFASEMVPYLEAAGLTYLRTERPHPAFATLPENLGYRSFSAAYGNIYTARQLRQLLERAFAGWVPAEDRWHLDGRVVDPFRPGLRHAARSDEEFDLLTTQHLAAVREAFATADVVVFTLGLTEAWESVLDGAVFPACPGTVSGHFDVGRHRFRNFSAQEVHEDLIAFLGLLRARNPATRLVLTVSPVPLVATATAEHVLAATVYSKAVLRVAAGEVAASEDDVVYFPAYEIVTGPQALRSYFAPDRRNVSEAGVQAVMEALLASSDLAAPGTGGPAPEEASLGARRGAVAEQLSRSISDAECEEVFADR